MATVSVRDISKSYGSMAALKSVSLDVTDGEFLTLLGPSGCGKSTLLRIIAGLEAQDHGAVAIAGRVVDALRPRERDVAMVFQNYALYPHMTVAQNLALPLRMRRLSAWRRLPLVGRLLPGTRAIEAGIDAAVVCTARALDIEHLLARKPGQMSGGQRQRVAVGRAMVREPAVFLMDEPLSNLDAKLRVQLRAEIKELHRRLGTTFVYVTHDQSEAMTLSDRVAVMLDGELLQVAPPRAVYADPDTVKVAAFIGSPQINLIAAMGREDGAYDAVGATLVLPRRAAPRERATLGIRPEAFALANRSGPGTIAGRVRLVEHLGSDLFLHIDVPGQDQAIVARVEPQRGGDLVAGATIAVTCDPHAVLLFDDRGRRIRAVGGEAEVTSLRSYA